MDSCCSDAGADALGRLQAAGFEVALNRRGDYVLNGPVVTPSSEGGSADSATASNTITPNTCRLSMVSEIITRSIQRPHHNKRRNND